MKWIAQKWCGLGGHTYVRTFNPSKGRYLRCLECDHQTPGFGKVEDPPDPVTSLLMGYSLAAGVIIMILFLV